MTTSFAATELNKQQYHCEGCSSDQDAKRLPRQWKRDGHDTLYCGKCFNQRYVLRPITFPVAGPVGATWDELRPVLQDAWTKSTDLANLAVQTLMMADVVRTEEMTKLPKMAKINLYQLLRPYDGWAGSASALLQSLTKKYNGQRVSRIWQRRVDLPDTKYPHPYPVHNASWSLSYGSGGEPLVTFRLPLGRFTLRLRGGDEFRYQLGVFRQLVFGDARKGELSLFRKSANKGDHRNGVQHRDEGGNRQFSRVMCKMVAYVPKRVGSRLRSGTLFVSPAPDAMLKAVNYKGVKTTAFIINGDHIPGLIKAHQAQLQRWSEDSKMEVRRKQRRKPPFASRRKNACRKFNNRMDNAVEEMSAQVVNYANRRCFATVQWVPTEPRFVESFRWSELIKRIRERCLAVEIAFEQGSDDENSQTETA